MPGGRVEGSKNKLSELREVYGETFEEIGGKEAFAEWAKAHRTTYYKLLAKLFPQEVHGTIEHKHEDFIKRLIEVQRQKELESGQPIKMIDVDIDNVSQNLVKESS